MNFKEKINKMKEKAKKVRTFISEHRGEIGFGMAVIGGGLIGYALNGFIDDYKYGGCRRADGYIHHDDEGNADGYIIAVSPTVREMKKDKSRIYVFGYETEEEYENAKKELRRYL